MQEDTAIHNFLFCMNHFLQITYSVPFSVTAELTADSGGGQGLWKINCSSVSHLLSVSLI